MADFKLKKGYDIRIAGKAEKSVAETSAKRYALKPTDFRGVVPKLEIAIGDHVKAGSVVFHEKKNSDIKFTSPVSGTLVEVIRGERRRVLEIVIEADGKSDYAEFKKYGSADISNLSADEIKANLLSSGLWPCIVERPYGRIANQNNVVRDIFISAMDSAPLAADPNVIVDGNDELFQAGLDVLSKLTEGSVHLSIDGSRLDNSSAFTGAKNVKLHTFNGAHPAGNVGVQIHHIKPINRGEIVWTVRAADVLAIGRLFSEGHVNLETIVAVAGENATSQKYFKTIRGAEISSLLADGIVENSRIISGNVLTGSKVEETGFLGFNDNTVTIIPEGNQFDFLGWVRPSTEKESFSGTFLSKFFPKKEYSHTTNLKGGHRAFVQSGYYEQVLPMDVYPVQLLKSCLAEDLEEMEGLGIYEIIEEDLALCEYVCASKVEVQEIVSDAIDLMIREM